MVFEAAPNWHQINNSLSEEQRNVFHYDIGCILEGVILSKEDLDKYNTANGWSSDQILLVKRMIRFANLERTK